MALLNRLFSSRRKQQQPQKGYGVPAASQGNPRVFEFSKEQVRVLLFRECERRGRKLLFDSKAVKKVPLPSLLPCSKLRKGVRAEDIRKAEAFVEITNGFGYQYTRPSSDVKPLGEMIFGSVAMALRGSTFKVHVGGSPPVLMLTKVSNSPSKRECERGLEDSYGSSINSMNEYFSGGSSNSDSKLTATSGSCPLDVPLPSSLTSGVSQFLARSDRVGHLGSPEADSGCYASSDCSISGLPRNSSFNAALASPDSRKGSGGSLSSLRRRWLRTASTSLDLESSQSFTKTDSLVSCGSLPANGEEKPLRRAKIGVAVIISLTPHQKKTMQEFFLEHAALLESMAVRLHAAVERAYCRKELFVSMMFDASCDIEQNVEDLLLGPRLALPVWLGLLSATSQHSGLSAGYMQELCQMLDMCDTKDTNFFMSTLVTAVLTHHLGWVPTVTPGSHMFLRQSSFDEPSMFSLPDLPKIHPYNPLWAQAMDLYGALGNPLKTSRTIIMSLASNKNRIETIEKMLRIISYFIRCAAIERQEHKLEDFDFHSSINHCSSTARVEGVETLSVDDRASSSSTLRPQSGKCSPSPCVCLIVNNGEMSNCCLHKPKTLSVVDSISSRSENSLLVDGNSSIYDPPFKKSSSIGLRRTMSYSSRMTSSALNENKISKEKQVPLAPVNGSRGEAPSSECATDKLKLPVNTFGSSCPMQNAAQESCAPLEKVVFVLGENENLIVVKGKIKETAEEPDLIRHSVEMRGKQQEQPLSFSGSEVESGFSECESFELSPVRSGCGNLVTSNDKVADSTKMPFAVSSGVDPTIWCANNEKNISNVRTCSKTFIPKEEAIPLLDANPRLMTIQSTFIQAGKKSDPLCVSSANLRSLARSLSVNLPVCLKSARHDLNGSDLCVACGGAIADAESKENVYPTKESKPVCSKKTMRRLRRAHSSFCVQSQSRKCVRGVLMCQSCNSIRDSCAVEEKTHSKDLNHICSALSTTDLDSKTSNVVELPLPLGTGQGEFSETVCEWGIAGSLFGGVSARYMPERVLQGCAPLGLGWEMTLKRDLSLDAQHPTLDPGLSEAVAIVANVDSWEVQLISSHTYVVDRPGTLGVRAGLSQLVANMLESVHHMWKLHASPEACLSYLESRLQEILLRSQALSELLLTREFCDMDNLTSSLSLEPNDVPLLLSVASTHSPEVTQRYGLSFR